ncbi:MAG: type II toxin-antitoxin system RelE/ParE family toxin [Burkholderiales bacterium]|nr:type II toxin-antitoxin system RelE/ParE family toxin [Burkholderiales bacterium]
MKTRAFEVDLTDDAAEQLQELFLYKVEQSDFESAVEALDAIENAFEQIGRNPYMCPMADNDPTERKLVIPFGRKTGYVALFSIESESLIYVTAIRHQRQDDLRR